MTDDLRVLLKKQDEERERLKKAGTIVPNVFFRMVAKGRRGPKSPRASTGRTPALPPAVLVGFLTTSAERRSENGPPRHP
jgi:hypothetical protein